MSFSFFEVEFILHIIIVLCFYYTEYTTREMELFSSQNQKIRLDKILCLTKAPVQFGKICEDFCCL